MSIVFEKLSQVIGAGLKWDIGIAGSYLRLSNAQWPCTVLLYKQGRVIGQMANMLAGDYVEGVDFDAISILNGATAQTLDVQISGGGAGSNRVLGEVSVIDGGKFRTLSGMAFIWASGTVANAGNYSRFQMLNPAGSGKRCIIKAYSIMASAATSVNAFVSSTALTNLFPAVLATKYAIGAAPVMQSRWEFSPTITTGMRVIDYPLFTAAGVLNKVLQEPIVLIEGYGLTFENISINQTINAGIEWIEE